MVFTRRDALGLIEFVLFSCVEIEKEIKYLPDILSDIYKRNI